MSNRKAACRVAHAIAAHLDYFKNAEALNWAAVGAVLSGMPMPFFKVSPEADGCFTVTIHTRGATADVSVIPGPIGSYSAEKLLHRLVRAGRRQRYKAGERILAAMEEAMS